jgi:hypothetical protein
MYLPLKVCGDYHYGQQIDFGHLKIDIFLLETAIFVSRLRPSTQNLGKTSKKKTHTTKQRGFPSHLPFLLRYFRFSPRLHIRAASLTSAIMAA